MKIFVFDTETTWFINKQEKDLDKQPHIIQFAGILWEINELWEYKEIEKVDILINPKIPIPYSSSEIHHIYDIDVKNAPYIEEVIDKILEYINWSDIIIWHNIEYDENMIKLELKRLNKEFQYHPKQVICTMNETINFCKLPKKNKDSIWYKRPKLWELHKKLFNKYFVWAHDAMTDVEATLKCFLELYKKWVVEINTKNQEQLMTLF
jgi:DNA polymerase III epsilon subunit-like protein